jgi:hypothetical protein
MDRITLIALLFSALGCVPIDGGAVEVSWIVATHDGRGIASCGCTCPPVAKIRLQMVPKSGGSDPCAGRDSCQFSCDQRSGATRFDIPPGTYDVLLVPVGADGLDIAPGAPLVCGAESSIAPVERDVIKGRVTEIDSIIVLADCAADCGGWDNTKVCTK